MADKQILAKYVHDAVEMEVFNHTLKSLLKETKKRMTKIIKGINDTEDKESAPYHQMLQALTEEKKQLENPGENQQIADCYKEIDNVKRRIRSNQEDIVPSSYLSQLWGWIVDYALTLFFGSLMAISCLLLLFDIVILIVHFATSESFYFEEIILFGIIAISLNLPLILWSLILTIYDITYAAYDLPRSKKELIELEKQLEEYKRAEVKENGERKTRLIEIDEDIKKILYQLGEIHKKAREEESNLQQLVIVQTTPIEHSIETANTQLSEFYSLNLIPPDYRSLECVIAFDQMFRNDLVDTMRDAVLLYEERVFRGEMIKGLDNIYNAINNLSSLMSETVTVLRRIESNTARMCDELMDISSNLVRMNANVTGHLTTISSNLESGLGDIADGQRDIAAELEYSRYVNDAIRANSDRIIWYEEQRRQGLL